MRFLDQPARKFDVNVFISAPLYGPFPIAATTNRSTTRRVGASKELVGWRWADEASDVSSTEISPGSTKATESEPSSGGEEGSGLDHWPWVWAYDKLCMRKSLRAITGNNFLFHLLMIAFFRRCTVTHPWNQVTLTSCTWMDADLQILASGSTGSDSELNWRWIACQDQDMKFQECHVSALPCRLRPFAADIAKSCRPEQANCSPFFHWFFPWLPSYLVGTVGWHGPKVIHRYPSNIHPYFSTCCFHQNELWTDHPSHLWIVPIIYLKKPERAALNLFSCPTARSLMSFQDLSSRYHALISFV